MKNELLSTEELRKMHGQAVYVIELGGNKGKYWDIIQVRPDGHITLRDHPYLDMGSEESIPWLACLRKPTWEDPLVGVHKPAPRRLAAGRRHRRRG